MGKADDLNIHAKIKKIQVEITSLVRTEENKDQNYKFFNELQVLKVLKPLLDKNNLTLYLSDDTSQPFVHEKEGNLHLVKYCKKLEIVDCETEDKLEFRFWAGGQSSDLAKAKGAAETYATKYLLSKFFLIKVLDENDPDLSVTEDSTATESQETLPAQGKQVKAKEFSSQVTATIHKLKPKVDKNGNEYRTAIFIHKT